MHMLPHLRYLPRNAHPGSSGAALRRPRSLLPRGPAGAVCCAAAAPPPARSLPQAAPRRVLLRIPARDRASRGLGAWGGVLPALLACIPGGLLLVLLACAPGGLLLVLLACAPGSLLAQQPTPPQAMQQLPGGPVHRGVVSFGAYQVFPENRAGNGIYFQGRLLAQAPWGQRVRFTLPLNSQGDFAYSLQDSAGALALKVYTAPKNRLVRLRSLAHGVYYAVLVLDGVVHKKLLRLHKNGIDDLLPRIKSSNSPLAGKAGVVFFHVAAYTPKTDASPPLYGLRLHLMPKNGGPLREYPQILQSRTASLKLRWEDAKTLRITHKSGQFQTVRVDEFR